MAIPRGGAGDCILKSNVTARDHDLILHAWLYNEATANGQLWLTLGGSWSLAVMGGPITP